MTIDELYNLLCTLQNVRNFESTADMMMQDEVDTHIKVIEREIKLKTINPTTGKPNELHRNDV